MKHKLIQYFDDHWYKIEFDNDEIAYYPSYTTKLNASPKPFLARWRGDIGNREADLRLREAAEHGTRVHHACTTYAAGGTVLYNPWQSPNWTPEQIKEIKEGDKKDPFILMNQQEMLETWRFQQFIQLVKPEIYSIERTVASHIYKEAGTLDYLFGINEGNYQINGKTPVHLDEGYYIADVKTGNTISDDAYMQISGYRNALEEEDEDIKIAGGLILHLKGKTKSGIFGLSTHLRTPEMMDQDFEDYRHVAAIWERKNRNAAPKLFDFPAILNLKLDQEEETNERE